jgi:DNA-binding GntR family transcriptional regulator
LLRDLLARSDRASDSKTPPNSTRSSTRRSILPRTAFLGQNLNSLRGSLALLKGTTYSFSGRPAQAQAEHRSIFEAIAKRDPEAAEVTARQHLVGAELARLTMMADPAHR